jgi:hypothetical protein
MKYFNREQSDEISVSSSCKFVLYNMLTIRGAFLSPLGKGKIFLLSTSSRPVPGLTQFPIQWVPGTLPPGVKRPRCEADNSPPTSVEVKNTWIYSSILPYVFMAWS